MRVLRSWATAPAPSADPRETLRWVRRCEVTTGFAGIAFGIATWHSGWWHWVVIAGGLLGLSPWPGAQSILRRAERDPGVLVSDPDRGHARGRRAMLILMPAYAIGGAIFGYAVGGWASAIAIGGLVGLGAVLGAWWFRRWARSG